MGVDVAVSLLIALLNQAGVISAVLSKAAAEGRTKLTPEEWTNISNMDDTARADLVAAIAKAKAEGR